MKRETYINKIVKINQGLLEFEISADNNEIELLQGEIKNIKQWARWAYEKELYNNNYQEKINKIKELKTKNKARLNQLKMKSEFENSLGL